MSKAMHTPGPWSTYLNTMDSVVVRKMGVSGYEIAHIAIVRTGIQDARLIAAAPELLEALKTAHAHIADDVLRASIGNIIAKAAP